MPGTWTKSTKKSSKASEAAAEGGKAVELLESFSPEMPRRRLEDLVVPEHVRMRIQSALSRIRHHKTLYQEWNLRKVDPNRNGTAINLFGPPGTGKTFCAEAIAQFLGKKIIRVNYAEIESKYVGETPKNITAAFAKASETDAVLFFDESDSILGKRLTNITQSADHGVNVSRAVMLTQLDKFSGVVVFATNLARNYDGAFVRRILAHIEFELPDQSCREQLWRFLIPAEVPLEPEVAAPWLAEQSEGLSGGDMLNVVISSASLAVERQADARKVRRQDLLEEIRHVRSAKSKIGREESRPRVLSETVSQVEPEALPPEVRKRYDDVVDRDVGTVEEKTTAQLDTMPQDAQLSVDDWRCVFAALRRVAEADGRYTDSETTRLQAIAAQAGLGEDPRIRATIHAEDGDPAAALPNRASRAARIWLREAIALAYADGAYSAPERQEIRTMASELELSTELVEQFEAWVHQGREWMKEGNRMVARAPAQSVEVATSA